MKPQQRKDISDLQVVESCSYKTNTSSLMNLQFFTGAPTKVCLAAMERAYGRDLIECGVSLATAWPTEKGFELIGDTP